MDLVSVAPLLLFDVPSHVQPTGGAEAPPTTSDVSSPEPVPEVSRTGPVDHWSADQIRQIGAWQLQTDQNFQGVGHFDVLEFTRTSR